MNRKDFRPNDEYSPSNKTIVKQPEKSFIRDYRFIVFKNGKSKHYNLVERSDGTYITSEGKDIKKLSSSTRNYMQNQSKFSQFFKEERQKVKDAGNYKYDSENYSGSGERIHVSSYKEQPKSITKLHNYGTKPYYLEFSEHKNIETTDKGEHRYDTTYYTLAWKPSENKSGEVLYIKKQEYKKDGTGGKETVLSKEVNPDNKSETQALRKQFIKIYQTEQKKNLK